MAGTACGASARAALARCSSEPSKRLGSVSTEIAAAPARAYAVTRAATSSPRGPSRPAAGERSFTSAMRSNPRSEEHTSELQSQSNLVCRLLLEKKKILKNAKITHVRLAHV